jgi:hypothetical protein
MELKCFMKHQCDVTVRVNNFKCCVVGLFNQEFDERSKFAKMVRRLKLDLGQVNNS